MPFAPSSFLLLAFAFPSFSNFGTDSGSKPQGRDGIFPFDVCTSCCFCAQIVFGELEFRMLVVLRGLLDGSLWTFFGVLRRLI